MYLYYLLSLYDIFYNIIIIIIQNDESNVRYCVRLNRREKQADITITFPKRENVQNDSNFDLSLSILSNPIRPLSLVYIRTYFHQGYPNSKIQENSSEMKDNLRDIESFDLQALNHY